MGAKDTVITKAEALTMSNYQSQIKQYLLDGDILWWEELERYLLKQAERTWGIAFKAGKEERSKELFAPHKKRPDLIITDSEGKE